MAQSWPWPLGYVLEISPRPVLGGFMLKRTKKCPLCGSTKYEKRDCGYSSFNPAWFECNGCGFKVGLAFSDKSDVRADSWNDGCELVKTIFELSARQRQILGFEKAYCALKEKQKNYEAKERSRNVS